MSEENRTETGFMAQEKRKLFYLVLDGLGDEPSAALDGQTPLQAARTPHLDSMARSGQVFRLNLADEEGTAATHIGQFALLGYSPKDGIPKRGPVEAAATGLGLEEGDVALRANLATLDDQGTIVDRRAGRIREGARELCRSLNGMDLGDGVTVLIRSATEHRVAIVLRGEGLGAAVIDSDPGTLSGGQVHPLAVRPKDSRDTASTRTAEKLELFLQRAHEVLSAHPINAERRARGLAPANALLLRQAGCHVPLTGLKARFGLRCAGVAAERTVIGVLRLLGAEVVTRPEFTANTDTSLEAKFETSLKLLSDDLDIVLLHVKATDILGHDQKPREKAQFLETLDAHLGQMLPLLPDGALVAVASDHSTSSTTGDHILDPVPALIWGEGVAASGAAGFDERSLEAVSAPLLEGDGFFQQLLAALGR